MSTAPEQSVETPSRGVQLQSFEQRMRTELERCGDDVAMAVELALGAAAACWDNITGAGNFRSKHARTLGDLLVEYIDAHRPAVPAAPPDGAHRPRQ